MFVVNVEGAVFKDGRWLIIERSMEEEHAPGQLSLAGGKVEQEGASSTILERTLKREIEEETGIEISEDMSYVHSTSFVSDDGVHVVDVVFLCEYKSGTPYAKSEDEVTSAAWMTFEEVMANEAAPPWLKNSIQLSNSIRMKKESGQILT
ncbi:NUDIX domain-containing protein [Peribacillus frigoritolerans]|uniref:NUDIX domain-containing protein n=1 Tax=Peribacillus frigoritolerans TaxID=450367 RepID=UPI0010596EB2|nr:NUDIX domain-containing protein [Peribacillus frigoritolerans]TDL82464.1 NUDIX domain-containing protein [Peribacillus frigoritolerans]